MRKIAVTSEVVAHLDWPGAAQAVRIERTWIIGDKVSCEVAYLITSLTARECGPERLLALNRAHWALKTSSTKFATSRSTRIAAGSAPAPTS